MSNESSLQLVHDGHEDRIQRLEVDGREIAKEVAGLTSRVDAGFDNISGKLDRLHDAVSIVPDLHTRLAAVESARKRRVALVDTVRKGAWALALAGGGVGVKELVAWLWHHG